MTLPALYYRAQSDRLAKQLRDALNGKYASAQTVKSGTVLNASEIAVDGQRYTMDTSGLRVASGSTVQVVNAGRAGAAVYAPAKPSGGFVISGGRQISASDIPYGTITADLINVTLLSALTANMGLLNAGSIVIGDANRLWLNDANDGGLAIGGTVKASAPFRVSATGHTVLTDIEITAGNGVTIGADGLRIGGVGASALWGGEIKDANGNGTGVHGLRFYDSAGIPRIAMLTRKVTNVGGFLVATPYFRLGGPDDGHWLQWDANGLALSGTVTAGAGLIGGWTIATDNLYAGNGASRTGLAPGTYPFYAGSETPADAAFRVNAAGHLVATDVEIVSGVLIDGDGLTLEPGTEVDNQVKWLDGETLLGNIFCKGSTGLEDSVLNLHSYATTGRDASVVISASAKYDPPTPPLNDASIVLLTESAIYGTPSKIDLTAQEINALGALVVFGTAKLGFSTNYTSFDATGHQTMVDDARPWRDELGELLGKKRKGARITEDLDEGTLLFADTCAIADDWVILNVQLNHDKDLTASIYPHLHWHQASANVPNWLLQYRWQLQGGAKTTAWTSAKYVSHAATYTSGTINQITKWAAIAPPGGAGLSDIVQFRLLRDCANASALFSGSDPLTGNASAVMFDIHFQTNSLGSDTEYTK